LVEQQRFCERGEGSDLLRVNVYDGEGKPLPSVELLVRWTGGEDRFFTGLKPDVSPGYADYDLATGGSYQVGVIGTESDVAQGISGGDCTDELARVVWEVEFWLRGAKQPVP
jgi:hypothetical protein